jgi:hypothetical protein
MTTPEKDNVEWEVLNPMAEYETPILTLSPRLVKNIHHGLVLGINQGTQT